MSKPITPLLSQNNSTVQTIIGGFCVTIFCVTWISSLMSPILLYHSISSSNHYATAIIISIATFAYIPFWSTKGSIPSAIKWFIATYHPKYYNKSKIIFEEYLPDNMKQPSLYAVHPHGAFSLGWAVLYASHFMENVRFCFSPVLYYSPFFKLFSMIVGNPGRADKASMISYMKKGMHLALPPGGFEEATITSLSHDRAYIKKRTGFVKLCIQNGYSITPVYCFGERSLYWNVQGLWKLRLKLNSFGVPAIFVWGTMLLPLLPRRSEHGMYVAVGKPIIVPKIENPSKEDVKMWHDKYMAALLRLFDEHKQEAYGDAGKTMKLELW